MSLLDQLKNAKTKLSNVSTKVVTEDGRERVEQRDPLTGNVLLLQSSVRPYGFVGDLKPDLQIAKVLSSMFVGGQDPAQEVELLHKHNISHVLNLASLIDNHFPDQFVYKKVDLLDLPSSDIRKHFGDCFEFIDMGRKSGGVYIHCNAGVSRSVTVTVAYIMSRERLSLDAAMSHVKSIRTSARPNIGFQTQLQQYEKTLLASQGIDLSKTERSSSSEL